MSCFLCISATYLDQRYHGCRDGGEPEWPPSPLRLFQALLAANTDRIEAGGGLTNALLWLESKPPPTIVAPRHELMAPYTLSVPNNAMDVVARAWSRGNYSGVGKANPATHRSMKTVRATRMIDGDTVNFLWSLGDASPETESAVNCLIGAAGRMVALGWGIDMVIGRGERIIASQLESLDGERWEPTTPTGSVVLRTPIPGTLAALKTRHLAFLRRLGPDGFTPVEPLTHFEMSGYRRTTDPLARPFVTFGLREAEGDLCSYPQRRLIHLAGMLRHLAINEMTQSPPPGVDDGWVERYVAGHRDKRRSGHSQFSYLPLPSIGTRHADQLVRRIMIAAPTGDGAWLEHLARRLDGRELKPESSAEFGDSDPPSLVRAHGPDGVERQYTGQANRWSSVTPVILPGHDDRKPGKTRKLIESALAQSGIDQPCTYEWSGFSRFPKSLSAHKYDRKRQPTGYIRPDHLLTQTAVHLTLQFNDELEVPGPLMIGAGRHCGLGVMAVVRENL